MQNEGNIKFNYESIVSASVKKHISESIKAAKAEGNDLASIEVDRIISEVSDKLSPSEYSSFDWDAAETFLLVYTEKEFKK